MTRGLALVSKEKRREIARMGGLAPHEVRGLQGVPEARRKEIAHMGGNSGKGKTKNRDKK